MRFKWFVVIASVGGAGLGLWTLTRPEPVSVTLYSVSSGNVEATVANTRVGTVKACRRSRVAPATGGQVTRVAAREGSKVKAGDLLLEVWNEDLKAEIRLASSEAIAAQARLVQACAQADGAEREAQRLRQLKDRKLVSEENVDVAITDSDAKRAGCNAARASVEVSTARVAVVNAALEKTRVRAPFAGIVAELNAELGEYVTPSPPGIATLPALDLVESGCLYISAPIDEVDAPAIQPGMSVCVTLDAFPDKRCSGYVRRIAPYVLDLEKQARTVEVEVELNDQQELSGLLPGYSADIEITLAVRDNVLRVPTEAVLEGNQVLILDPQTRRLLARSFQPGISNWKFTEIESGLQAGEQIVVSVGREGVTAGAIAKSDAGAAAP